ncbi:hypothetical protein LG302_11480 [Halomonas organivorans]
MSYREHAFPSRRFLYIILPLLAITLVAKLSPTGGAFLGFMLAGLLSALAPIFGLPVVLLGVGLNNLTFVFGLQFGWILVAGAACGAMFYIGRNRENARVDLAVFYLIIGFVILEVGGGIFRGYERLDRLFALVTVLVYLGILGASRPEESLGKWLAMEPHRALIYLLGITGCAIFLNILVMLSADEFNMSRVGELGLSIGDTESSPRSLSNILGLVIVACVGSAFSMSTHVKDKTMWLAFGIICMFGLFYTGSRMPTISTILGVGMAFFMQLALYGRSLKCGTILWSLLSGLLIVSLAWAISVLGPGSLPFIDSSVMEFRLLRAPEIESNIRLSMWAKYLSESSYLHILFGSGIGYIHNPHSLFVGALAAFGLIGIFMLLAFVFTLALAALKIKSMVSLALITYILLALTSSSDIDKAYFWIMIAVVIVLIRVTRSSHASLEGDASGG